MLLTSLFVRNLGRSPRGGREHSGRKSGKPWKHLRTCQGIKRTGQLNGGSMETDFGSCIRTADPRVVQKSPRCNWRPHYVDDMETSMNVLVAKPLDHDHGVKRPCYQLSQSLLGP